MMLAFAIASRGQIDEAIPHALEALRLRPTEAPWHFTMAMMYLDVGDRTHAISQLETALRLNPSFTEASRALAELRK
jgi:predicted Zn-dependent protease